jgi:shikimate dehydrogenase
MKAAVLGSPIAHSLSPALHRAAYQALGLDDWTYEAIECDEAGLAGLIEECDEKWAGLSLTMPLKRTVLPLLDQTDPLAKDVGGANTVVFTQGKRHGYNTDVPGMLAALAEAGVTDLKDPLILGAGATACSALAALRQAGRTAAVVAVRDPSRATTLLAAAHRIGIDVTLRAFADLGDNEVRAGQLLISTLPAGAADFYAERVVVTAYSPAVLFDVVYAPWPTVLAQAAAKAGAVVVRGFEFLLHQAAGQVELMTGQPAPLEAMRAAGLAELGTHSWAGAQSRQP